MGELGALPLSNALSLWMQESPVGGEEAERADMLLVWVLTLHVASHGVVGPAGLGAGPGRRVVLCWELVAVLYWSCHCPWSSGVQRGRKMLSAREGPCRTLASPPDPSRYSTPVLSGSARHHTMFWPSLTHKVEHPILGPGGGWPFVS